MNNIIFNKKKSAASDENRKLNFWPDFYLELKLKLLKERILI